MRNSEDRLVPDHGPWTARIQPSDGRLYLDSDDFHHDALLTVTGDFGTPAVKEAYGHFLADVLNRGCKRARARQELGDGDKLLSTLVKAAHGPDAELLEQAADEIARLRCALEEADEALKALNAHRYFTRRTEEAKAPSAFAQALAQALKR